MTNSQRLSYSAANLRFLQELTTRLPGHYASKFLPAATFEPEQFGVLQLETRSDSREVILTFVNLLHELDPDENAPRVIERLETEHGLKTSLDSPMVLLNGLITNDKS